MRSIKFRAWIKNAHRMENCIDVNPFYIGDCDRLQWHRGDVVLMQYTGLKDKNGKEIYEGDIVTLPIPPYPNLMQAVIEWNFDGWKFRWLNEKVKNLRCREIEPIFQNIEFFEVIGNISETPELCCIGCEECLPEEDHP